MKKALFFLTGCIVFAGCKDDTTVLGEPEAPVALEVSTRVGSSLRQSGGGVVWQSDLRAGSQIGISVFQTDNPYAPYPAADGTDPENNCWILEAVDGSEHWVGTDRDGNPWPFLLSSVRGTLVAYYPYEPENYRHAAEGTPPTLTVRPGTTDYLSGKSTAPVHRGAPAAYVTMDHALSMLSFAFTHEADYTGRCMLQSLRVRNLPGSGILSLGSGKTVVDGTLTDLAVHHYDATTDRYTPLEELPETERTFRGEPHFGVSILPETGTALREPPLFHLFVLPAEGVSETAVGSPCLELRIDGIPYLIPFPNDRALSTGGSGYVWHRGTHLTYRVAVGKNGIRLSTLLDDYEFGGEPDFDFG